MRLLGSVTLLACLVVACASRALSSAPSATTTPSPAASATTAATATPEPQGARAVPTACMSVGEADCRRAADAALAALDASAPAPIYLQVGPFGCATGERCPTTLAARPEGDVLVEFVGVPAVTIHLTAAADGSLRSVLGETFGIIVPPTSERLAGRPVMPFTLGHCGLYSGIDLDGAWWDPIGPIDAENGDAVNAAEGRLAFVDPAHATFVSRGGLTVNLARRDGPKHLPFCD